MLSRLSRRMRRYHDTSRPRPRRPVRLVATWVVKTVLSGKKRFLKAWPCDCSHSWKSNQQSPFLRGGGGVESEAIILAISVNALDFLSQIWSRVGSKLGPRFVLLVVPQLYSVFWDILKRQIVCRGAKINFGQFARVSKRIFKKKCIFVVVFLCWKRKRNYENTEKENAEKCP